MVQAVLRLARLVGRPQPGLGSAVMAMHEVEDGILLRHLIIIWHINIGILVHGFKIIVIILGVIPDLFDASSLECGPGIRVGNPI